MIDRTSFALFLAILLGLAACTAPGPEKTVELEPLPAPSLDTFDVKVREQLQTARQDLDTSLASNDDSADLVPLFGRLGQLYQAYDLLEPAAAAYRNARQLDVDSFRWAAQLGAVYQRQGKWDEAATELLAAEALQPEAPAIRWRLGEVEQARGRTEEARQHYQRALEIEPLCEAARFGLAELDVAAGRLTEAVQRFKTVLTHQPMAVSVHYPLAQALNRLGRADEAQTHLQIAAARKVDVGGRATCPDPLDAELAVLRTGAAAHLALGRRAALAGQSEVELAEYRKALDIAPDDAVVRQSLGGALARGGKIDAALEQFREAARLEPQNADFQRDIGVLSSQLGQLDEARQAFEKAVDLRPDFIAAHWLLAQLLQLQEQHEAAVARYETVLHLQPDHAEARAGRALALAQLGRAEEARSALASLLDEQPPLDPGERFNLASGIGALGDIERAITHFAWAAENATDTSLKAQANLRAGLLLEHAGRREEAIPRLREAIAVDPSLLAAQAVLQKLESGQG